MNSSFGSRFFPHSAGVGWCGVEDNSRIEGFYPYAVSAENRSSHLLFLPSRRSHSCVLNLVWTLAVLGSPKYRLLFSSEKSSAP